MPGSTAAEGAAFSPDDVSFGATGSTANGPDCVAVPHESTAGCYDGWNEHTHGVGSLTVGSAGTVAGTNAPYVQYLACQKN